MKKAILLLTTLFFVIFDAMSQSVDNVNFNKEGRTVVINYKLSGCERCDIAVFVSLDGGKTFNKEPLSAVSGDVGKGITAGKKRIVWDVFKEYPMGINADLAFMVRITGNIVMSPYLTFNVNGVSFEMIYVKGGTFSMGATSEQWSDADYYSYKEDVHQVTLSGYYIGKFEVTQGLWKAVMGSNPSRFKKGDNYPVEQVSWDDIVEDFLPALNAATGRTFALPTEAQWEFAARGGTKSKHYKYSGSNTVGNVAWNNSGSQTHPVGQKQANELGIYDMSGNVFEWCSDWYDENYYQNSPSTNPQGPVIGSDRVERGGSWLSDAIFCRVSYRSYNDPGNLYGITDGFRLVLIP